MADFKNEANVSQDRRIHYASRDEEAGVLREAITEGPPLSHQNTSTSNMSIHRDVLHRNRLSELALALPIEYWTLYVPEIALIATALTAS
jgi:hypothetical protein